MIDVDPSATVRPPDDAGVSSTPVALPVGLDLPALCEAFLFVAAAPTSAEALAKAVGLPVEAITTALDDLELALQSSGRGLRLQRHGAQYALTTAPPAAQLIARFLGLSRTERLSPAALETLAIVAYRGPVTRGEIESIRGVDSSGVVQTLLARELIEALGRRTSVGQPVEYAVTVSFLRHFGLASLAELPPLGEVNGRSVEETWDERSLGARAQETATPPEE